MHPGMQHMIDMMQRELDSMREQLAQTRNGGNALEAVREYKRGPYRPRMLLTAAQEFKRKSKAVSGWWMKMTPAERSAEMKRRYASRKDHPPTGRPARRGDNLSTGQSAYWAKMTKEERRAEMQRRAEVRAKNWAKTADIAKLHPRDPRSPRHAEWRKTMSKAMKKSHAAKIQQHVNGEAAQ